MFYVTWDPETGGVRLSTLRTKETLGISPRPVFFEELDLLKLNNLGWTYPRCKEPLLWACNKQYFYRGQMVFEVKGANIYDPAQVIFQDGFEKLTLTPVDVPAMLKACEDEMFLAESEALEFIRNTYIQYASARESVERVKANQLDYEAMVAKLEKETKKKMAIVKQDCDSFDIMEEENAKQSGKKTYVTTKIDKFLASFSGGKDSQVVLDLCTRAIPPSEFEVIYSDTGYELPTSLTLWEEVQTYYKAKFPELRFRTARNHESVLNYWDKIGTPSDTHRWCCSVMKTAPLYRMMKIDGTNKQAKVMAYEGVRADESIKRSAYKRLGKGTKHSQNVINAHPILFWNTAEVFLYLFKYSLPINNAYKIGKPRVGCLICPFSSEWDDMISNVFYKKELAPFTDRISEWSKQSGINDVKDFLVSRKWKIRSCGPLSIYNTKVILKQLTQNFIATIENPKNDIFLWFPALGDYYGTKKGNVFYGELKYDNNIYSFEISEKKNAISIKVYNVGNNVNFISHLRKLINKTAFCVQCEICEIDCPTGALNVVPNISIDKEKCINCHKCFDMHDNGCVVADATRKIVETNKKTNMIGNVHAYKSFGLRDEWLSEFFASPYDFWTSNSLGTAQVDSLKGWLKDASILDAKNQLTNLGVFLRQSYMDDPYMVWEIIWINLACNSYVVRWFANNIQTGQPFEKKSLVEYMLSTNTPAAKSTIEAAAGAILQLFRNSPLGEEFGFATSFENGKYLRKDNEMLSNCGFLYYLYKYAELSNTFSFRMADCFSENCELNAHNVLGINKSLFEKQARTLNSENNRLLIAELNMGLDHITLKEEVNPISAIKLYNNDNDR